MIKSSPVYQPTTAMFERMSRKIWPGLLLLVAFAMRWYKIDSPMWLDEIYGFRLARLGLARIIQNSWTDPHPPLYYLVQWIITGFGQSRDEIGWRLLPLICGVLTVYVVWLASEEIADTSSSFLSGLVLATSPYLIYYSQDARPFALMILFSSVSTWLTLTMLQEPARTARWVGWAITSLLGMYSGYAYFMILATQLGFLAFFNYRRAAWWISSIFILVGIAPLLPFAASSLGRASAAHANAAVLTLGRTLQTLLAGETIRYGLTIAHLAMPILVIGICILGVIRSVRLKNKSLAYVIIQVVLPLGLFFSISPILGIRLPLAESKQFTVLLPALFLLIASGFNELKHQVHHSPGPGTITSIALGTVMVVFNLIGLGAYWSIPKGPESLAVVSMRGSLQPGERIVSLHYQTDFALGFYITNARIYLNPEPSDQNDQAYRFQMVDSDELFAEALSAKHNKSVEQIRANGEFWVLAHTTNDREALEAIVAGCQIDHIETFSSLHLSFELLHVKCPPTK